MGEPRFTVGGLREVLAAKPYPLRVAYWPAEVAPPESQQPAQPAQGQGAQHAQQHEQGAIHHSSISVGDQKHTDNMTESLLQAAHRDTSPGASSTSAPLSQFPQGVMVHSAALLHHMCPDTATDWKHVSPGHHLVNQPCTSAILRVHAHAQPTCCYTVSTDCRCFQ